MQTIPLRMGYSHRMISTISRLAPAQPVQKGSLAAEWLHHDRSGTGECEVIQELVAAMTGRTEPNEQNGVPKTWTRLQCLGPLHSVADCRFSANLILSPISKFALLITFPRQQIVQILMESRYACIFL